MMEVIVVGLMVVLALAIRRSRRSRDQLDVHQAFDRHSKGY